MATPLNPLLPGADNLQQAVRQRVSRQATGLQAAQAAMGVPGQMLARPNLPAQPARPSRVAQMAQSQEAERNALAARGQDLKITERLLQVLDPRIPKQARQFLYKELSRTLGIDPKGERAKDVGSMLTSLDPQTLEGLREEVSQTAASAQPGQVSQLAKGIVSGNIDGASLAPIIAQAAQPQPMLSSALPGGDGMMRLGGPTESTSSIETGSTEPVQLAQAGGGAAPVIEQRPFANSPVSAPATTETKESGIPPLQREAVPELTAVLGLDPTVRYRNRDLYGAGWNRIPGDSTKQHRLATDIKGTQDGLVNTLLLTNQLADLIQQGGPEALDIIRVKIPLTDSIVSLNPSNLVDQLGEFARGVANSLGVESFNERQLEEMNRAIRDPDAGTPALKSATERITRHFQEVFGYMGDTAVLNARIRSIVVPLAFAMASAKGQTGRHLSDRDVELMLNEIGISQSPKQMLAAIKDTVSRIYDGYNIRMRAFTGGDVPIHPVITPEVSEIMQRGGMSPTRLMRQLGIDAPARPSRLGGPRMRTDADLPAFRPSGEPSPLMQRAMDTTGAPMEPPGDDLVIPPSPVFPQQGEMNSSVLAQTSGANDTSTTRTPQERRAARTADRPPIRGMAPYRPRTIPRSGPTLEEETAAAQRRAEEERAYVRTQRARAAETHELQIRQSERAERADLRAERGLKLRERAAVRAEDEARRQAIQEAFNNVAKALTSAGGGGTVGTGLISPGNLDQDPGAFRIAPSPQRRAPAPVNAAPYRRR